MEKSRIPQNEVLKKVFIFCDLGIKYLFFVLLLLVPIFFIPKTLDFFDFNKAVLFYVVTALSLVFWGGKMVSTKTFFVRRSVLDLPLILLLTSSALATFFSSNKYYSLIGTQGTWEYSLISFVAGFLYFYTVSSNIQRSAFITGLRVLVVGSAVSSLILLLSVFGINLLNAPWSLQFFFPLGNISSGVVFLAIVTTVGMGITVISDNQPQKGIFSTLSAITAIPVIISLDIVPIAIIVLGIGLISLLSKPQDLRNSIPFIGSFVINAIIFLTVTITPSLRQSIGLKYPLPRSVYPSAKVSWTVASGILGEKPFFGAGLNNYGSGYTLFKPIYVNTENTWNARFNRAGMEVINIVATMGIVGLLCFVFLTVRVLGTLFAGHGETTSIANNDGDYLKDTSVVIKISLALIFVLFWFRPTTLPLFILLFGLLSGFSLFDGKSTETRKENQEASVTVLSLATVATSIFLYFVGRAYLADIYFRKSLEDLSQGGTQTHNLQRIAVSYNPLSDLYRNNYAQSNLALANALSQKKDLTDADKSDIQILVSQAIRETRVVTETLSPLSANAWEVRGDIYRSLDKAAQDANSWAISAYNNAISLDPNNPRLRLDLGGIYFTNKDYQNAAAIFASATRLKNDYANAHFNLAQTYKELKAFAEAKTELEIVLRLIPNDSEDAKAVKEDLDNVSKIVAEQQKESSTNKPKVEQIEAKGASPTTNQEPLTNPATPNPAPVSPEEQQPQ
jgi:tetratricopeptide (TPR) repeat protein